MSDHEKYKRAIKRDVAYNMNGCGGTSRMAFFALVVEKGIALSHVWRAVALSRCFLSILVYIRRGTTSEFLGHSWPLAVGD